MMSGGMGASEGLKLLLIMTLIPEFQNSRTDNACNQSAMIEDWDSILR